ncbi:hypothetical protein EW026_g8269 [Hermanssonia centrifuga]|uniref:Uncharacterized protein n=1 Tax=Hermanssonia centrifuga TaxID=98765 RepID=A0A4S4K4R4_9APHY|nr:hypothetical protein EW026_g8269 [Hermanssonia centrifuga]
MGLGMPRMGLGMPRMYIPITAQAGYSEPSFDAKVTKNRKLSDDYERIISQIRQLNGFSTFLQATPFTTLQTAAKEGPFILVNVDEYRSDALILRATGRPLLVPLAENLLAVIEKLSTQLAEVDQMNRNANRYGISTQAK